MKKSMLAAYLACVRGAFSWFFPGAASRSFRNVGEIPV
jgi:hypothetical protein